MIRFIMEKYIGILGNSVWKEWFQSGIVGVEDWSGLRNEW